MLKVDALLRPQVNEEVTLKMSSARVNMASGKHIPEAVVTDRQSLPLPKDKNTPLKIKT